MTKKKPGVVGRVLYATVNERAYLHAVNVAWREGHITDDESVAHAGEIQRLMDRAIAGAEE